MPWSNSIEDSSISLPELEPQKIGAWSLTARSQRVGGRESISISVPGTESVIVAKKVLSRSSLTEIRSTLVSNLVPSMSTIKVVGHRPRRVGTLELHQDRGRFQGARSRSAGSDCRRSSSTKTIGCLPTMSKLTP